MVLCALVAIGICVVKVDPFFHYHKPLVDDFYYPLNNQRSQNDGILKHFEYDALITGTSMIENFRTSEFDKIFGVNSIKVSYAGASYKEINDNLITALKYNPNLKTIVRGLDMSRFFDDKDAMSYDLNQYPVYLYDEKYLNDVNYIFNRNVFFDRVCLMMAGHYYERFEPGITSFDEYSNVMNYFTFGLDSVIESSDEKYSFDFQREGIIPVHITDTEKATILGNVDQNITSLAREHPDVTFYYFFTPYSIIWWLDRVDDGSVYGQIEAEQIVIEEILKCPNIRLYSFNTCTDIVTDLNNYKDAFHYGEWINSLMLKWMYEGEYLLTKDNYKEYLSQEFLFYNSYNYDSIPDQQDYENDYYVAALLNKEINNVDPLPFSNEMLEQSELKSANIVYDQHAGNAGIECKGSLQRNLDNGMSLADYIINEEYVGCKICLADITDYHYLVFYGKKNSGSGQPSVILYDQNHQTVDYTISSDGLDNEWHQYVIDVSLLNGKTDIIFHGGGIDNTGGADTSYTFSDIILY